MECPFLLVTLLLITKKWEVSGQRTGRIDYGNPTSPSSLFQPDFYSCLGAIDQSVYLPCRSSSYSSYGSSLPQIIIDNTRDDDDDWLSLLYFLIIALKDRKSGCSYKSERPRPVPKIDYSYDERYIPDNNCYCDKCDSKTSNCNNNDNYYKSGNDQCPFGSYNCNGGCNCIFIPYPIAVPINYANGQFCNDVEICACASDFCTCNKTPCNCGKDNEICVTIRNE